MYTTDEYEKYGLDNCLIDKIKKYCLDNLHEYSYVILSCGTVIVLTKEHTKIVDRNNIGDLELPELSRKHIKISRYEKILKDRQETCKKIFDLLTNEEKYLYKIAVKHLKLYGELDINDIKMNKIISTTNDNLWKCQWRFHFNTYNFFPKIKNADINSFKNIANYCLICDYSLCIPIFIHIGNKLSDFDVADEFNFCT